VVKLNPSPDAQKGMLTAEHREEETQRKHDLSLRVLCERLWFFSVVKFFNSRLFERIRIKLW
jgi:hypothetical protein